MSNAAAECHYGVNDSFHEENEETKGSAQGQCSIQCENFLCMSLWPLRQKRRKGSCEYGWNADTDMLVSLWCCGEEGHANKGWFKTCPSKCPRESADSWSCQSQYRSWVSVQHLHIIQSPHLPQYTGCKRGDFSCQLILGIAQHYWQHSRYKAVYGRPAAHRAEWLLVDA